MATTKQKVAGGAGALTAGTIALSAAMFNHWEGRNYTAVHLPFDPPGVTTVCGGVTNYDIPTLKVGMKFTEAQCLKMISDLIPKYAAPVMKCVPNFLTFPDYRQAAIISFAINLGPGKVCGTSIGKDLSTGRITKACNAMSLYVNANGKRLQGLDNRRNDPAWGEKPWCLAGVPPKAAKAVLDGMPKTAEAAPVPKPWWKTTLSYFVKGD